MKNNLLFWLVVIFLGYMILVMALMWGWENIEQELTRGRRKL